MRSAHRRPLTSNPNVSLTTADAINRLLNDPESIFSKEYAAAKRDAALFDEVITLLSYITVESYRKQRESEQQQITKQQLHKLLIEEFVASMTAYYQQKATIDAQAAKSATAQPAYIVLLNKLENLNNSLKSLDIAEEKLHAVQEKQQNLTKKWDKHQEQMIEKVLNGFGWKSKDECKTDTDKIEYEKNAKFIQTCLGKRVLPIQMDKHLALTSMATAFRTRLDERRKLLRKENTDEKKSDTDTEIEAQKKTRDDLKLIPRNINHIVIKLLPEFRAHVNSKPPEEQAKFLKLPEDKNSAAYKRRDKLLIDAIEKMLNVKGLQKDITLMDDEHIENGVRHHDLVIVCNAKKAEVNASLEQIADITQNNPELHKLIEEARRELNSPAAQDETKEDDQDKAMTLRRSV